MTKVVAADIPDDQWERLVNKFATKPKLETGKFLKGKRCLEWTGSCKGSGGYGHISVQQSGSKFGEWVHRMAYQIVNGRHSIPDGWTIDHLCLNKKCVEERHLEPVTRGENSRRALLLRTPEQRAAIGRKITAATKGKSRPHPANRKRPVWTEAMKQAAAARAKKKWSSSMHAKSAARWADKAFVARFKEATKESIAKATSARRKK